MPISCSLSCPPFTASSLKKKKNCDRECGEERETVLGVQKGSGLRSCLQGTIPRKQTTFKEEQIQGTFSAMVNILVPHQCVMGFGTRWVRILERWKHRAWNQKLRCCDPQRICSSYTSGYVGIYRHASCVLWYKFFVNAKNLLPFFFFFYKI